MAFFIIDQHRRVDQERLGSVSGTILADYGYATSGSSAGLLSARVSNDDSGSAVLTEVFTYDHRGQITSHDKTVGSTYQFDYTYTAGGNG